MNKTLLLALSGLLILPSVASAATVDADIKRRGGTPFGPVTFKAAKGEVNRVTVRDANGQLRFSDSANRVTARGDCEQVDRHTALCPFTEDIAQVRLGNRSDRATVSGLVEVFGGSGNDLLTGSTGNDRLDGQGGRDTLRGAGQSDVLTGGPGRDRVFGGGGDDELIDGETDKQSAPDVYRGGSSRDTANGADRGDQLDYSKRKRALKIDLSTRKGAGDSILGLESLIGGSGNDTLSGDGDDNWLEGNSGRDRLRARGGDDIPQGGAGNDTVDGGEGNDVVWGDNGLDKLIGADGDDLMIGRDSTAELVECGAGEDVASVTRLDTLRDCERASSSQLSVTVQPEIQGNRATFQIACLRFGGCTGAISISGLDTGEAYGSGEFAGVPHGADRFTAVEVELTQAGRDALQEGQIVQVTYPGSTGGYRTFMRRETGSPNG